MKKIQIGVQGFTIKPEVERIGFYETLKKCNEIGYHCFEISQVPMTEENINELKRAQSELGITVGAMSALVKPMKGRPGWVNPFDNLEEHFDKIVKDCKTVGCDLLRIGALPSEILGSYDDIVQFSKEAEELACRLKAEGIDLYYHTHHFEFGKYNGEYVLDIIKNNTTHVGFELDIHWIQRGGEDPVRIIKRFAGRVRLLHLKDYRINSAVCCSGGWMTPDSIEFAEIGEGNLPIAECIEAGIESGCDFFFIEQDKCYDRSPLESLKISYDNLVKMGYGKYI